MRLKDITATADPRGNRITLSWINPQPLQYPGIRVVRREDSHPTAPEDGELVAEGLDLPYSLNAAGERCYRLTDSNLKGETVYYYMLFAYLGDPPSYDTDVHNRAAAMATSSYNMAGRMYELLPGIYQRYDSALPRAKDKDAMAPEDRDRGQLGRFLDLPGYIFDQLYSYARSLTDLHNIERVDGRLMPLLADWIGWQTDYRLEIDAQRNELRNAPAIYQTIGIIPTLEATVKRILGWGSRAKEFVHNVFVSNRPERLNLWCRPQNADGSWSAPVDLLSLDFAYEGRPAAVCDADGIWWLFYHTLRNDRWDIWYKTLSVFSLDAALQADLDRGVISAALQNGLAALGIFLSENAFIQGADGCWLITDFDLGQKYSLRLDAGAINVYHWWPSQPLTNRKALDKQPAAAVQGDQLWVFWHTYDEQTWQICYRTRVADGQWSAIEIFKDSAVDRKEPVAVVDGAGDLWLFWLERASGEVAWRLKYLKQTGPDWMTQPAVDFPEDSGADSRVEGDVFALAHPGQATQPLWVFWGRRVAAGGPNQTRWEIVYRVKADLAATDTGWSSIRLLPKVAAANYHDRDPAALVNGAGNIEVFWSSNRDRSWSIWQSALDVGAHTWAGAVQLPSQPYSQPYSQRNPLPLALNNGILLVHRSNESVAYTSKVYAATETIDFRYAGATTVDSRNLVKIALQRRYHDFQSYTYDTGKAGKRTDANWYCRDTVGMYVTEDIDDPRLIVRNRAVIEDALRQFLPIQVRPVFIIPVVSKELVYTYDFPDAEPQYRIIEDYVDSLEGRVFSETYTGLSETYADTVPEWSWMFSWSEAHPDHRTVDSTTTPVNTRFRTWHIGITPGG